MSLMSFLGLSAGGGLLSGLGLGTKGGRNLLFGQDEKLKKKSAFDPMQQQLWSQMGSALQGQGGDDPYGRSMGYLQQLLDPSSQAQEDFAAPYMRQFNEQTLPGIAERFAGMGAQGGALSSSGFGQALGSAGAGLQETLAQLRTMLQGQGAQNIFGQFQQSLQQQPFSYYRRPASPGLLAQALPSLMQQYMGG